MISINGFLMTGTRIFCAREISRMDLWHTDDNVQITLDQDQSGQRIVLDEDESRMVRRWAELEMQASMAHAQSVVVDCRCDLQEHLNRAQKLNKAASKARRTPQAVVDINVWKSSREAVADPCNQPAA